MRKSHGVERNPVDQADVKRLLGDSLPEPFLRSATEAVFLARRIAWEHCREGFAEAEAENLCPFETRAQLEQLLRAVADRHNLQASALKQPGQPWNHTEVSNGRVVMTAATVQVPGAMVQDSDYRRGLASTGQQRLFNTGRGHVDEDLPLYVLLTHSRYRGLPDDVRKYGHLPGSVALVCPAADFKCYVYEENLLERFPDIARKHVPHDWDEEAILRYLVMSRKSAFG